MADVGVRVRAQVEVHALDDGVHRGDGDGLRGDHRGIVSGPAKEAAGRPAEGPLDRGDQLQLAHGYSLSRARWTALQRLAERSRGEHMGGATDDDGRSRTVLERAGAAAAEVGRGAPRRPRLRAGLRWAFVVLVLGFLVGFVVTQWDQLPDFEWRFRPAWLILAAAGVALFYLIHAEAWRAIVRGLGAHLDGTAARAVWGKSILARYVPTNALMVVGRVMMAERLGVGRRVCVASMIYELGLALSAAVLVGAYFVITMPALDDQPARYAVLAVVPAALVALHPRVFRPVADYALRKLGREPATRDAPRGAGLCAARRSTWSRGWRWARASSHSPPPCTRWTSRTSRTWRSRRRWPSGLRWSRSSRRAASAPATPPSRPPSPWCCRWPWPAR